MRLAELLADKRIETSIRCSTVDDDVDAILNIKSSCGDSWDLSFEQHDSKVDVLSFGNINSLKEIAEDIISYVDTLNKEIE